MKWNELIKVIVLTIASMLAVEAAVVVILTSSGLMSTQFGKANINDSGDGQTEQEVVHLLGEDNVKSEPDESDPFSSTTESNVLGGSDDTSSPTANSTSTKVQNKSTTQKNATTKAATTTTTQPTTTTTKSKDNDGDWIDGWY